MNLVLKAVLALSLMCLTVSAAEPPAEPISRLLAATFRITDRETSGTGFMVAPPPSGRAETGTVFIVTAAHTFDGMPKESCTLVLRETKDRKLVRKEVALKIRSDAKPLWTKHREADVAVIRFAAPGGLACEPLPFDRLARDEDFNNGTIVLGADAWIFTFPVQLEANGAGLPVLRRGCVSSLPLDIEEANSTFLVDFSAFGGDSGAPLMVATRSAAKASWVIGGMVQGMQRQTDKFKVPFQETTLHYPLGLGIVVPATCVRQTIEAAFKQPS